MSDCSTKAWEVPLKPCPFCGGEAKMCHVTQLWEPKDSYWAKCADCHMSGKHFKAEAEAIAAWNTRAGRGECENANTDGYCYWFECSSCGYSTIVHNCATRLDELPYFCPNCGSEVAR